MKNKIFQSRDLCLRALDTNSVCAKSVRRNERRMKEFEINNENDYLPLRDVVFNTLRTSILTGELKPGERLMEIHLADKLGVSRTPIREAIRKLELEGQRTRTDRDAQARNRDLLDMQGLVSRFEQKKLSADMEEKQILDKLWDNYELSRTAAEALRQPVHGLRGLDPLGHHAHG